MACNILHLTTFEPPEISIWAWKTFRCVFGTSTPKNGGILDITMFSGIGSSMMPWLKVRGSALLLLPAWSSDSYPVPKSVLLRSSFALCNSLFALRASFISRLDASASSLNLCCSNKDYARRCSCSALDSMRRRSCSTWNSWTRLLDSLFSRCRVCIALTEEVFVSSSLFLDIRSL